MLIDSHCHLDRLDLEPFDGKLEGALDAAREQDVGHMLCVCIDMENLPDVLDIARRFEQVSASVGVHPEAQGGREPEADELADLAGDPQVVAIGETGLDYFRCEGDMRWQQERLRRHVAAARRVGKPLIIHMREATEDTLGILREERAADVGGVMHCFVEDWAAAKAAMDLNFYISFSGIVTFRNATQLKDVAARMPEDRILIETDSPYLAPVPLRGRSNQPAYVRHVAEHIAELRGTTLDAVAETTTRNYFDLFGPVETGAAARA